MQRQMISRSSAGSLRRALAALGLTAGLCSVLYTPLRAAGVRTLEEPTIIQVEMTAAPTTAAEALPSLPQRLTAWLYSVERSVQQSSLSNCQ
jgi:hypothetical protein